MSNIVESSLGFTIENLTPELSKIYPKHEDYDFNGFDDNILILDFGEKKRGDIIQTILRIKGNIKFYRTGRSCGCTSPKLAYDGEDTIVELRFDTNKVTQNVSEHFWLYDYNGRQLKINLIINSTNN